MKKSTKKLEVRWGQSHVNTKSVCEFINGLTSGKNPVTSHVQSSVMVINFSRKKKYMGLSWMEGNHRAERSSSKMHTIPSVKKKCS